jgi:hypothetical protein
LILDEKGIKKKKRKRTQAHAPPSESNARQCHPPVAACTIRDPNRAEILRGFRSAAAEADDDEAAAAALAPFEGEGRGPCPRVPLAFQPQASTLPSASRARVHREPATSGQRLNARPRSRVPSNASTTLGDRTSASPSRPSWPSSLTPESVFFVVSRGAGSVRGAGREKGGARRKGGEEEVEVGVEV